MMVDGIQRRASGGWSVGEVGVAFLGTAVALTAFGVLMVFSASSISALTSGYGPAYYAVRQLLWVGIGTAFAILAWRVDYHAWSGWLMPIISGLVILALVLTLTPLAGQEAYGATRWIGFGPFHLQPSEFAKISVLLATANLAERFFETGDLTLQDAGLRAAALIALPLALVLKQPDKGTVLIIAATVLALLYLGGFPLRYVLALVLVGVAALLVHSWADSYSRARMVTMLNPWADPYGDGYQLIQGFYAFGSGGLFGVGLGMSRQKYSYLPMAHNDFIFAVIGEELGLVGTLIMLAFFVALIWLGIKVAREARDLAGTCIAAGSVTTIGLQLLVNACGVLGIIPLSGKPIPFISYGGSSVMSTLILVGLTLSVARVNQNSVSGGRDFAVFDGRAGGSGLRVVRGGASRRTTPESLRASRDLASRDDVRISVGANGRQRIDLGRGPGERLRQRSVR